MTMFTPKPYRIFLGKIAVTPLLAMLLLSSCGGDKEKPDLGPRRAPRDNAAVSKPTPPPRVDALIPGFDIPAPRYHTPVMVDEVSQQNSSMQPPMPQNQNGMVYAPPGTPSMGGYPPPDTPVVSADGRRQPSKQFIGGAPVLPGVPPMMQTASPAPSSTAAKPMPHQASAPAYHRPMPAPAPYQVAEPKEEKSFWDKVAGIFSNEKPEPKRVPGEQGHVVKGPAVTAMPTTRQGFSELPDDTQPQYQYRDATIAEKAASLPEDDTMNRQMVSAPARDSVNLDQELRMFDDKATPRTMKPVSVPKFRGRDFYQQDTPAPVQVPQVMKKQDPAEKSGMVALPADNNKSVKQTFAPVPSAKMAEPSPVQVLSPEPAQKKNILEEIEERRKSYGYQDPVDTSTRASVPQEIQVRPAVQLKSVPKTGEVKKNVAAVKKEVKKVKAVKTVKTVNEVKKSTAESAADLGNMEIEIQDGKKFPWQDIEPESGANELLDVKASVESLDAQVLLEFDVDNKGNLVGIPPANAADAAISKQAATPAIKH